MAENGLRFEFEWRITVFTLVLLPLFVALGFWQLERADEKRRLGALFDARQQERPAALPGLFNAAADELAYRPVKLRGEFDPRYFLLDNRMQDRRYGNEVVQLFHLAGGAGTALVNRGWVAADPARRALPAVATPDGQVELTGRVYVPPGEPYLLGEQTLEAGWPKRVQALDMTLLAQALEENGLFPYSVRMDAGQPGALAVDWPVVNVSPAKHRGYALQWFTMALALAIIYLLRSSNLWQLLRGGKDETSD